MEGTLHALVLVVCGTMSTRPKDPHEVSQPEHFFFFFLHFFMHLSFDK